MVTHSVSEPAPALSPAAASRDVRPIISWPAVFAGNAVTAGFITVLLPLGAAAGLSMTSPYAGQGASGSKIGMLAIFWLAFMYLFSVAAGGYVAGRLRPRHTDVTTDEVRFRDGMNGFVFWGVGMMVSALFTFMTVSSAVGTATRAVGQAAGGIAGAAGSVASAAAPSAMSNLSSDYLADLFLRSANSTNQPSTNPNGPQRSEADVRAEIGRIMARSAAAGDIEEPDRAYLAQIVARQTGLPENEARARVDETIKRAADMRQQAIAKTKAAAEEARKISARAAFWTALASLVAGIVAYYAAQLGGRHRDEGQV